MQISSLDRRLAPNPRRAPLHGLALGCALLWTSCGKSEPAPAAPRSVLLVTIDTLRADRLGCYGYELASTPNIDALAERGVRLGSTFSVAPLTLPSHVSLMTGTIPPFHGVRENGTFRAAEELDCLAEILSTQGMRTAAFTAAFVLDSQFGLEQGFEVYGNVPLRQLSGAGLIVDRPASEVNAEAVAWLRGLSPEEPYFLWVHYFEPHLPHPPEHALPPEFRGRPYDAEVATADRALGELLGELDRLGRTEETLVVLTSDHGEGLGEHGEETHSFFVYQSTLHVPLIFAHPSLAAGRVADDPTSLVDVMPTVLELLELEIPALPPPARSLVPLLRGEPLGETPAYFESLNPLLNYGWAPLQGVATGRFKLIRAPRPELYDLREDPRELQNLHASEERVARALEEALDDLVARNEALGQGLDANRQLSEQDRANLARLGYTGTASATKPELVLLDPKDGLPRIQREERLHILFAAGRYDEVVSVVEDLLREDPANPVFNAHYGFLMLMQNRFPEAVTHLRRSVESGYCAADNLSNLGVALFMTQELGEARATLERALEVDRKHLPTLFWLARTVHAQGAPELAREHLRTFLALYQGGDDPLVEQARAHLRALGD